MKKGLLILCILLSAKLIYGQGCFLEPYPVLAFKWSPAKGALARYAAGVTDTAGALAGVIFIGEDPAGIYTIDFGYEGGGRGYDYAWLSFTGFDGSHKTYPIYDGNWLEKHVDNDDEYAAVKSKRMTEKIWEYCGKKILQPSLLKPVKGKAKTFETAIGYVSPHDCLNLVWRVNARSHMCWCHYQLEFESRGL